MTALTVFRAERIYTGSGTVVENGYVLVDGGVIVAVERSGVEPPLSAELVALGDITLLPGPSTLTFISPSTRPGRSSPLCSG